MTHQYSADLQRKFPKPALQILVLANSLIIGLLGCWLILGNLLAAQQEATMRAELKGFSKRFPKQETNSSAIQLEQLRNKLGLTALMGGRTSDPPSPSEADRKSYEAIRKPLSDYVQSQITKPNDPVDALPRSVNRYLTHYASDLAAIRKHILSHEAPRWATPDFQETLNHPAPSTSFINIVSLQNILLADALEANRLGLYQRAFDNLATSWKINQFLDEDPQLISLLVSIITSNQQTGVLRKMNDSPPTGQQQMPEFDRQVDRRRKSLMAAYESESFTTAGLLWTYSPGGEEFWTTTSSTLNEMGLEERHLTSSPVARIQQVFQQPYFRLIGVSERDRIRNSALEVSRQDCSFDAQTFLEKHPGNGWFSNGDRLGPAYQRQKVYRNLINLELTHKVLQVKQLVAKSSKAPQQVLGIERSQVCPSLRWNYQVSSDGKMSISLQNRPQWLEERKGHLPLSYQLSLNKRFK